MGDISFSGETVEEFSSLVRLLPIGAGLLQERVKRLIQ